MEESGGRSEEWGVRSEKWGIEKIKTPSEALKLWGRFLKKNMFIYQWFLLFHQNVNNHLNQQQLLKCTKGAKESKQKRKSFLPSLPRSQLLTNFFLLEIKGTWVTQFMALQWFSGANQHLHYETASHPNAFNLSNYPCCFSISRYNLILTNCHWGQN